MATNESYLGAFTLFCPITVCLPPTSRLSCLRIMALISLLLVALRIVQDFVKKEQV
jgi:hypothetical protein